MAVVSMNRTLGLLLHEFFELCDEPLMPLLVIGLVAEHDVATAIQRDAVLGVGQVFGCQPEVERVICHQIQGESRRYSWRSRAESDAIQLANERNVAHRMFPVI